jgi:hypothetical protein
MATRQTGCEALRQNRTKDHRHEHQHEDHVEHAIVEQALTGCSAGWLPEYRIPAQENAWAEGATLAPSNLLRLARLFYDRIFHWLSGVLHQFSTVVFAGGVAAGIVS